ncbi:cora-like Mg2+ transporter protein [Parathielavia appendiculata]|uniref:Cora-like Mg2+ transporter protein n=1 Tax=Parathielavia appendiculata TaxID=2587402 RepID=A0AAN6UB96_9PEZI|nr:cora-like Mg2+ transporter protein [Parathielavia appendiculata]
MPAATSASTSHPPSTSGNAPRRRKNHRGGRKKKARRKSFALPADDIAHDGANSGLDEPQAFYARPGRNLSTTSIDSEALLDHRDQQPFLRPRRPSVMTMSASFPAPQSASRLRTATRADSDEEDEGAPLLSSPVFQRSETFQGYGSNDAQRKTGPAGRRDSSRASSNKRQLADTYNVNYPPSVPGSPTLRPSDHPMTMSFGDVLLRDDLSSPGSPKASGDEGDTRPSPLDRRKTIALQAQEDVCYPQEGLSDIGDDELAARDSAYRMRPRRRRRKWPDLSILDEWSRFEKEGRSEERRAKKITEPQLINGRLRPVHRGWFQAEEEAPYRFTYFNEEFPSTIHSQTISELVQPGGTFRELFIPDPPILSDTSDGEEEEQEESIDLHQVLGGQVGNPKIPSRQPSLATATQISAERQHSTNSEDTQAGSSEHTPSRLKSPDPLKSSQNEKPSKPLKYGDRPVWWLDVLSPTEAEMKVISKAFGIHPLTAEDIMMQEQREKVELFRNYYFVNYRSFDQDQTSENFLEPVNMYVVVFREGVLSFHFSVTPHPANVRRRIRQLRDYLILSSDWISYAIIDDITDVFGPLIQNIEDEVDDIDFAILQMHSEEDQAAKDDKRRLTEKPDSAEVKSAEAGRDMLRRVGDCRKKVMSLYRLLSNKADVIKGFAKRCNEHWEVAPRSEIGLYLGDIQDHIVTMTSNLSHYEKILARSHGNYLAQINIRMNERQEQTADVLGKLTVLGTIVLPMNIITGLWGMNVWVPGQEHEGDLRWFTAITACLLMFGVACYLIAKRVYNIV